MVKLSPVLKKLILRSIRFYQKWISLDQSITFKHLGIQVCRFDPYCSEYAYQAIDKYGVLKGSVLGCWRILRCNPFTKGGHDPVN